MKLVYLLLIISTSLYGKEMSSKEQYFEGLRLFEEAVKIEVLHRKKTGGGAMSESTSSKLSEAVDSLKSPGCLFSMVIFFHDVDFGGDSIARDSVRNAFEVMCLQKLATIKNDYSKKALIFLRDRYAWDGNYYSLYDRLIKMNNATKERKEGVKKEDSP